jgi:hypothetical protein
MKIAIFLLFAFLSQVAPQAQSAGAVSIDFFYESLDPYGDWREVGNYGYCWQPRNVHPGWSPYSE